MDLAVRVVGGDELLQGEAARVDGACGREDEAVVDVGLGGTEGEGLVVAAGEVGEGRGRGGGGDAGWVEGEVGVCGDADLGVFDCGRGGEVEVAAGFVFCQSSYVLGFVGRVTEKKIVRVVRHVDDRFLCAASQGCLVLHPQQSNLLAALGLLASRVHDTRLHRPREPLIPILTRQLEPHALPALINLPLLPPRDKLLLHAHGHRALPNSLSPALGAAVQVVGPIVGAELVGFVVERGDGCVGEAVRDTTDGGAKMGGVVGFVVGLRGEVLDNVVAGDGEGLQDRAEGEEGDFVGGHFGGTFLCFTQLGGCLSTMVV